MTKLIMFLFAGLCAIQLIKPLGWPGLRYRRDAWKLAVAGFLAVVFVVALRTALET